MHIDHIFNVFKNNISNISIIWKENEYTYKSLLNNIEKSKLLIDSHSIIPGSVVALIGDFSLNSIAMLFALIESSCIIVPLSGSSNISHKKLFDIAKVEFLFLIDDNDDITFKKHSLISHHELYNLIREKGHPGLVLFTSGTTGEPKAAVHDFLPLLEKFKSSRKALRTLNFLLFDHWGGLNTLFHILSNGGVVVITNDRNPENICKIIEKFKIELLPASPTFLNLLLLSGAYNKFNLSSMKIISYGTEPMPEYTLKRLIKFFLVLI